MTNKLWMTTAEYKEDCGQAQVLFEIADNLRIIAGQLAEINGYIAPQEEYPNEEDPNEKDSEKEDSGDSFETTIDFESLPEEIKELFAPKKILVFIEAVETAMKKGDRHFTCPICGGEGEWYKSKVNGHIHAWCNKCDIELYE